jgi:ATP-dependent DNA helicase PIF1
MPSIPMILTDMLFEFKRLQYPVRLAFAMTINKAQGHRFSHGQLYVACSRVGNPSDLLVYTPEAKTKNIVYLKALQ